MDGMYGGIADKITGAFLNVCDIWAQLNGIT